MRWIWVIAKIEAEEEMGAWVRSLPPSEGLCLSSPFLLFCWSWKVGKRGGTTFLSGCVEPEWLRWWGSKASFLSKDDLRSISLNLCVNPELE
eukprot:g12287.t1